MLSIVRFQRLTEAKAIVTFFRKKKKSSVLEKTFFWLNVTSQNNCKSRRLEKKRQFSMHIFGRLTLQLMREQATRWQPKQSPNKNRSSALSILSLVLCIPGTQAASHAEACQAVWKLWCGKSWVCREERQVSNFSVPLSCPSSRLAWEAWIEEFALGCL